MFDFADELAVFSDTHTMNEETSENEEINIKTKLKEMQKHIPLLQKFLRSTKNGENNAFKHKKLKMIHGLITGEIPCTKLVTLMRIEEAILKKKEIKQTRVTQRGNASTEPKSSKENASEIINLDSSDDDVEILSDDDIEIVSYTLPDPRKIISGTEDNKYSASIVLIKPEKVDQISPDELEIQKNEKNYSIKEVNEILTTSNKAVTSDINKNNKCVPDLNKEAEKIGKSVNCKTNDYICNESVLPSASIPKKSSSTHSTESILKDTAEISSTTLSKVPKVMESNKSAELSQNSKTKSNEVKEILKLNVADFEDVSSEEANVLESRREMSQNLTKLSNFEKDKKLLNEEDVSVTTTNPRIQNPRAKVSSSRKYSNVLDSIDPLQNKVENAMEKIQDSHLFTEVEEIVFADESHSEVENNEEIVSSTSEELSIYKTSEDFDKISAEVSSSFNECGPQIERRLQTSPVSQKSLSSMANSNNSKSSKEENENKDVKKSALNKDKITSSQDSGVLWINDAETEDFIRKLNLEIGLESCPSEIIDDKQDKQLTKDTAKSSKCKTSKRCLLPVQSPSKRDAPKLRSEVFKVSPPKLEIRSLKNRANSTSSTLRSHQSNISTSNSTPLQRLSQLDLLNATKTKIVNLKNQVQALKGTIPINFKNGPSSPLQDRLINAGLLSDRRNSSKQTELSSCTITTTEVSPNTNEFGAESQNSKESQSFDQHLQDISRENICLKDKSNERRLSSKTFINPIDAKTTVQISPYEKSFESAKKDNTQISSSELSNSKRAFENASSPLKDRSPEEEMINETLHTEHKETLHCDILNKLSEHLLNKPEEIILDTHNESGFSNFTFCTKDTSDDRASVKDKQSVVEYEQNQSAIPSTNAIVHSVVETEEQIEEPLFERRIESLKSEKQALSLEGGDKVLNPIDIQKIEQSKNISQDFLIDSVNENSLNETSTQANVHDRLRPLQISYLDERAKKHHEIRFQLEKETGIDLGITLSSGQNEATSNTSESQLRLKENTMDEQNFTYETPQPILPTSQVDEAIVDSFIQSSPNVLGPYLGLPSELKASDPRFRNRLELLYRKTNDPVCHPKSLEAKHYAPKTDEALQSQDQGTKNEMQSAKTTNKNCSSPAKRNVTKQYQALNYGETVREDQKSNNEKLKNLLEEVQAPYKKVSCKAQQVKCTSKKGKWKFPNKNHKLNLHRLKTVKSGKQNRHTIQIEAIPRKNCIVKSTHTEILKFGKERRKTIQTKIEATSKTGVEIKSATAETTNEDHQLELKTGGQKEDIFENERSKTPTVTEPNHLPESTHKSHQIKCTAKKERRKTLEKPRRISVAEVSNNAHQLKLQIKLNRLKPLQNCKMRRNSIQAENELEAEIAKQKFTVESTARKTLKGEGRERRKSISTRVETASEAEATKNKVASKTLRKTELKLTPKKYSNNTLETEDDSHHTISNFQDIGIKIATRKRKKLIKRSSSDSKPEGWIRTSLLDKNYHSDIEDEDILKVQRKKKAFVLSSSSESEADTNKSQNVSRKNITKRRKTTTSRKEASCEINNCVPNETNVETEDARKPQNEFQEQNAMNNNFAKLDTSNPNDIKDFVCKVVKPLLKDKSFEMFQQILGNSFSKSNKNKRKSISPTDVMSSRQYKVSFKELRALHKDLDDSFIGNAVRKITSGRRNSINGETRNLSLLTAKNSTDDFQIYESEKEKSVHHTSILSDEDYDTDSFEEHVSRKKKDKEVNRIISNPPVVLLTKLVQEDLTKPTTTTEEDSLTENVTTTKSKLDKHLLKPLKDVQFKHYSKRRKSQCAKTKSKKNKNTNPSWHYKDPLFSTCCILCSDKFSNMVEHYLRFHPHDEVYISRLPPADVRYLEENPGRATRHLTKQHQYIAKCHFCGHTIKGRFDKLSHHYATHTGEFPYMCSTCNFMSCNKSDMVKHTKLDCKKDAKLKMYYTYNKNVTKINLYVCTKCNYMQLHEANIIYHLRKEHDCNEIRDTDLKELILLEIVDDLHQSIVIANEPVSSDLKSDEEIIFEIQPGGNLVLPSISKKEDCDTSSIISNTSIVKSETLLVDPCLSQSIAAEDRTGNDTDSTGMNCVNISSDLSLNQSKVAKSADTISVISGISADLRLENTEIPKITTNGDNIMTVIHNSDSKDNSSTENRSENNNDDIEELLRDLTCTPSVIPNPSESFRTTDQSNTTENLNPSVPANVKPQKVIEGSNQIDSTLEQINKSILPAEYELNDETKVKQDDNLIGSFTAEDHEMPADVEIQENPIAVIEILEDESETKYDFLKTEITLEMPSLKENENCAPLRVEHFGYQEIRDSEYIFHCFIEDCSFGVTISFEVLQDHAKKEHDVMWSGKCNVCKNKLAALPGKQPIQEELNHILSVHIKELQDMQNTDENHVINLLKPWLSGTKSNKKQILCESMLSESLLPYLYKCMGDDCSFTSDSKVQMSQHLAAHELKTIRKTDSERPWLECSYCEHYADKTLHILEHIERVHSSSIFQCLRCFYRSSSIVNVSNHQDQHHSSNVEKNNTFTCSGNVKTITDDFKRIEKLREDNIKAVSCSVCRQKYIRKDLMTKHFKMVHKESKIPEDLPMGLYSCIFCNFENDVIRKILLHMANKHPEELLLIGVRGIKESSVQDDISSILAPEITDQSVVKRNDISCSAGQATKQQSEISDVQKFRNNLMNMQDLEKLRNSYSTHNNSCEEQDSGENERALMELRIKIVKLLNSDILHPCCICYKEINLESQWTDHFNTMHPTISRDAVWQCPKCPKKNSFWTYPMHFINHHSSQKERIYFCYYCAKHFYDYPTVNDHLKTHTGKEVELKCTNFNLSQETDAGDDKINQIGIVLPVTNNSSIADIIKHMIKISKKEKENESKQIDFIDPIIDLNDNMCGTNYPAYIPAKQRYVCTPCNNIWIEEKAFENHFKATHKAILTFKCPHCDFVISQSSYEAVRNHLRLHSQEIIYKCCLCNMYTESIKLLIEHIKSYKRQSVPVVRFTRDDKTEKYIYKVIHFSPLSSNISAGKKVQCLFCSTLVGTYKELDMHISNVHKLGRTYQCYYCSYQGDIENVDSHIIQFHSKNFHFISKTVFLAIQNLNGNCSHLPDARIESISNISSSKVSVITENRSRKREHTDISDWPASDQYKKIEKRLKSAVLESDKSEIMKDGSVEGCRKSSNFKCNKYEDYTKHRTINSEPGCNSLGTSVHSVQNHSTTTSIPSSANKAPTASSTLLERLQEPPRDMDHNVRLVPMIKLLQPIPTNPGNSLQPSTFEEPQKKKKSLSTKNIFDLFTYVCFHCFTEWTSYNHLCKHWQDKTCPSNVNKSYRFRITRKAENFISRYVLDKIAQIAIMKSVYYQCFECGKIFLNKDFCIHHMAAKLLTPIYHSYQQEGLFYGCDECSIFYKEEGEAIKHIAKHTFRFSCLMCLAAYRSREELQLHYLHTHQINEIRYRYDVKSSRNMYIYQQMLVVFPCGLVLTKYYLRHTRWGNIKVFTKLIDKLLKGSNEAIS